jgi:aminoglycoside phosphotransferase (APT) family kinase protein
MVTGLRRDERAIAEGFRSWLRDAGGHGGPEDLTLARPRAGHSNETLLVSAGTGARSQRWVLRLPPRVALTPDHDLGREAAVLTALADAGLPVPRPIAFERDERFLGSPFLVLPMIDGHVVGEAPVFDPWIVDSAPEAQARVQRGFVAQLGALHRLDPAATGLVGVLRGGTSVADELAWWADYLEWAFGDTPLPTLGALLDHLRATAPGPGRACVVWGDARLGNVIYGEDRTVRAVLDWELATIGAPEMDLAWYLALEDLLAAFVDRRVPGFLERDGVVAAYEDELGRPVEHLEWHELFALLRSTAINARIARLADAAGSGRAAGGGEDDPVVEHVRRRLDAARSTS